MIPTMVRWIAFDDETAEAVVSRFRRGAAEIHPGNTAVDSALTAGQSSLIVFPSEVPGRVLLAHVNPKTELPAPPPKPVQFVPKVSPRAQKPTKKWWKRSA